MVGFISLSISKFFGVLIIGLRNQRSLQNSEFHVNLGPLRRPSSRENGI